MECTIECLYSSPKLLYWAITGLIMAGCGLAIKDEGYSLKWALSSLYLGFVWGGTVYGIYTLLELTEYTKIALVTLLVGAIKPKESLLFVYIYTVEWIKERFGKSLEVKEIK